MINLLPPLEKEELKKEESWKQTMILGILVLIFLISFSLVLFSIKFYIIGEVEAQKILYQQREKELRNPRIQSLQKNLISFNQILLQLDSFYRNQLKLTGTLEKISNTLPPGLYLTNLSLIPQSSDKKDWRLVCNMSGYAPTREALLDLKENLENEELFGEIYFPPANWVKSTDISFVVSFKIR